MPRNASGVYSKPAGTTAVAGEVIEAAAYNSQVDDMVADLNAARPITAGGTGATTVAGALTNLGLSPVDTEAAQVWESRAAAAGATINVNVNLAFVGGYAAAGDGGEALYKRAASEPSHAGKFQSADNAWWEIASREITPEAVGATGDDVNDDTGFQNWIAVVAATGAIGVGLRGSTYRITSTRTVTASNVILRGNGATINYTESDADMLEVTGTSASRLENFEFSGWRVTLSDGVSACIYARGVTGFRVHDNIVTGGRLLWSWLTSDSSGLTGASWDATKPDIASVSENDLIHNASIKNNRGTGGATTNPATRLASSFIRLAWAWDFIIADNYVEGDRTGIQWWGGDSNPGRDGGAGSVRWARRGTITGNIVTDMASGGIWGSQGMDITCTGNVTERCLDIGVHGEGSDGITVVGNTMRNCQFGGFNSYFIEERAVYSSNTVVITDSSTYGTTIIKNNMGFDEEGFEVIMSGNTLEMNDGTAVGEVVLQRGGTIRLNGNTMKRCVIRAETTNAGSRFIEDNHMLFDKDPGQPAILWGTARHVGSDRDARCSIVGNIIEAWGWSASGLQPAIRINHSGANGEDRPAARIERNSIHGYNDGSGFVAPFPQDIVTESTNGVGIHITDIIRNGLAAGVILDISDKAGVVVGSLNMRVMHWDNWSTNAADATPYTSGAPTQGVYFHGSRGSYDVPTAGDYDGWVAVGATGVQAPSSGTYSSGTDYSVGDQIDSSSEVYVAIAANGPSSSVVAPGTDTDTWRRLTPTASTFKGRGAVEA